MKFLKVIIIIIGVAAILLAGAFFYVKFTHSEKRLSDRFMPRLQKAEIEVTDLKTDEADVNINAFIYNPAPIGIKIDSLSYTVSLEDNQITESRYAKSIHIAASKISEVTLPVTVEFKKLMKIMKQMEEAKRDSGDFHLNAVVYIRNKLLPKKRFDLTLTQTMPMMYFPDMKVKGVKLDKIRLNGGTVIFKMEIKNKNAFDMSFKNLSYQVKLNNNDWIKGTRDGVIDLPAKKAALISVPLELNIGTMGKGLFAMLFKGGDMDYQMKVKADVVSSNKTISNTRFEMKAQGNVKQMKEAISKKD